MDNYIFYCTHELGAQTIPPHSLYLLPSLTACLQPGNFYRDFILLAEKAKNNLDTANFSLVINAKYLRQKGTQTRVALKVFVADEQEEVEEHK